MHDIFARVGGADANEVKASSMIHISSGNVIVDDAWLWRADHDLKGPVVNGTNPVNNAILVDGDNVIGYGIACEHTLGNLMEWNGENGTVFFYQSELPYDVDQSYADAGYSAYKVGDTVTQHTAYGVGVYSFFRDYEVTVPNAIVAPEKPGIKFVNSFTLFLNGKGGITSIIDDDGLSIDKDNHVKYHCARGGNLNDNSPLFLQK